MDPQSLITELQREAVTTRRVFDRIPVEQLRWQPHPKSMTMGQLALHIAMLPHGITQLITPEVAELPDVPLHQPATLAEVNTALEAGVHQATARIEAWGEQGLLQEWRMVASGATLLRMQRGQMLRNVLLNHTYHHRGQLTVYLRLLDVPLPPVYGPTADELLFDATVGQ